MSQSPPPPAAKPIPQPLGIRHFLKVIHHCFFLILNHSRTAGKFTMKEPKEDDLPTMMSRFGRGLGRPTETSFRFGVCLRQTPESKDKVF